MNSFLKSGICKGVSLFLAFNLLFFGVAPDVFSCYPNNPGCTSGCCDTENAGQSNAGGGGASVAKSAPRASGCASCSTSNHIIEATGNLYFQIRPFTLEGIGLPIEPVLTYNSKSAKTASPYGRGWCFNYDRRIKILDEEADVIECEDGRGNVYIYKPGVDGVTYTAKKRNHQEFSELYADGEDYVEEYANGTIYRFVMDGVYGYISSITDRHGNALTFSRDEGNKVLSITDSSNRVVAFTYSSGKLRRITLPSPGPGIAGPKFEFSCGANLNSYKTPQESLTTFAYNADYLMIRREHAGEKIEYVYDDPDDPQAVTERKRTVDGHTYIKSFSYDRANRKTTVVDEEDFTHVMWYDDFGDTVQSQTGSAGEGSISGWGGDGKRIFEVRIDGEARRYDRDERGKLVYESEGKRLDEGTGFDWGLERVYEYDGDNLVREEDSLGRKTTYGYDENNNRIRKTSFFTDPDTEQTVEIIWRWTYYANGLVETETDPNGNVTAYEYDAYGNPIDIQLRDPLGGIAAEEVREYTALNWLKHQAQRIDGSRWRVADYTHDLEGRVLTVVHNGDSDDYEENTYDCCHLTFQRDRNGNVTGYEYYDTGKVFKETRTVGAQTYVVEYAYNGRDEPTLVKTFAVVGGVPQTARETSYEYDAGGRKTAETRKVAAGHEILTDIAYDDQGRLASETRYLDSRPIVTSYEYDGYGRQTKVTVSIDENTSAETQYVYDTGGRRIETTDPLTRTVYYEYDELDRMTQTTEPLGRVTKYRYDGNGNRIKTINALNVETTYTYNALNKVASVTQPVNEGEIVSVTTSFQYDCLGNRTLVVDGKGNQTGYEYDLDGRLSRVTNANDETIDYTYYPGGQLKTLTDANGNATFYVYDGANMLAETKYAYGTPRERVETFVYDDSGNMISKTLRSGETITYEYDLINRMTKKTLPGDPGDWVVDYAYDDLGRMTSVVDGNGTIAYVHDDANRLLSVTYPGNKILSYVYDLVGNRTRLTYTDATYVDYSYDALNRMDQVKDQNENVLADYSYDALRRTGINFLNGTSAAYEYNDSDRVTALYNTQTSQGDISFFTYSHDQAGNRLTVTGSWGTQTYTYDDIYQVTGVDYPSGYPFPDMTYNYDPVGNRDSTVNGGTVDYQNNELNEYTSVGGTAFASDIRGNLTADGTHVYQYDLENRLTAIDEDITYTYNPLGLRTGITVGESTTSFILDDQREIEEWEGGELQRKFINGVGIDEPLVMETGGSRYYYHFDALGSVHNLTDSSGATVASYRYDIYGAFNLNGSSHGNSFAFTGRRYDPESGLYYYRARYYDKHFGRFLQTDAIGYNDGPSLYTYATNNPINNIDPFGYESSRQECLHLIERFKTHIDELHGPNRHESKNHCNALRAALEHYVNRGCLRWQLDGYTDAMRVWEEECNRRPTPSPVPEPIPIPVPYENKCRVPDNCKPIAAISVVLIFFGGIVWLVTCGGCSLAPTNTPFIVGPCPPGQYPGSI